MLVAVMIGLAQPVRLFLSRRRSIPRLRAARRWRMVLFTRNPPGDACLKGWLLFKHRRNTEGFRVSSKTTRRGQETSLIQGLARLGSFRKGVCHEDGAPVADARRREGREQLPPVPPDPLPGH